MHGKNIAGSLQIKSLSCPAEFKQFLDVRDEGRKKITHSKTSMITQQPDLIYFLLTSKKRQEVKRVIFSRIDRLCYVIPDISSFIVYEKIYKPFIFQFEQKYFCI